MWGLAVLCLVPLLVAAGVAFELNRRTRFWAARLRAGGIHVAEPLHPIFGNIPAQLRHSKRSPEFGLEQMDAAGVDVIGVVIPLNDIAFVRARDPRDAKHMLETNFENYPKGEFFHERMELLLGDGIFNTDGELWKAQRKVSSHLFKAADMKTFFIEVFAEHSSTFCDILAERCEAAGGETIVDVADLVARFTLDSVGDIVFGRNVGSLRNPVAFSKAFDGGLTHIYQQHLRGLAYTLLPKWVSRRRFDPYRRVIRRFCNQVVREKRTAHAAGDRSGGDLVSRWIRFAEDKGKPVDDDFLEDVMVNYLLAGRDTTAATISWALYNLAIHPEDAERLVSELDAALGPDLTAMPTFEMLKDGKTFPFLRAVIDETLRLHPPVYADVKVCLSDDTWPSGVRVPAGCYPVWGAYIMGRTDKYWGGGPSSEFIPNRWMSCKLPAKGDRNAPTQGDGPILEHSHQYIPFQSGPRSCIGKHMAMLECGFCLAVLMRRFSFEFTSKDGRSVPPKAEYTTRITMAPKEIFMKVSERKL